LIILPILFLATSTATGTPIELPRQLSPREIVQVKAVEYGVPAPLLEKIITCESQWQPTAQSRHIYPFTDAKRGIYKGQRERSFGLVQISLPHHPDITKEQAISPEFAIDFLAKNVAKGRGGMWSCFPKPMKKIVR
jgi:hypothetical protein